MADPAKIRFGVDQIQRGWIEPPHITPDTRRSELTHQARYNHVLAARIYPGTPGPQA